MRWMWIDRVIAHERGKSLTAIKNVSLAEEHLHDHFRAENGVRAEPVMPASLVIEGMAQTAGILVGAARDFREKVVLAKINRARFERDAQPGCTIRYQAKIERIDDAGALTSGVAEIRQSGADAGWEPLGEIELLFSHLDQNNSGLDLPRENFVFAENFAALLGGM